MAEKRVVAALMGNGTIGLVEQEAPELRPGAVRLEVHASLVSPGTELGGWRQLAKQRESPNPNAKPRPFGYSNAGVVRDVGEGVTEFKPGDRIACIGGGYAMHTDVALVPHHLCVALPEKVTYAQGAYAMLRPPRTQEGRWTIYLCGSRYLRSGRCRDYCSAHSRGAQCRGHRYEN